MCQTLEKMNDCLPKPALLVPSSDEVLEQASLAASEVTQQMLAQKLELEDKKRSVDMLQKALVTVADGLSVLSDCTINYTGQGQIQGGLLGSDEPPQRHRNFLKQFL